MSIPENNDQTTDTRNPPIAFSYATEQRDQHLGIQNEVYPLQMTLPIRGPRPKPVEQKKPVLPYNGEEGKEQGSTPRNSPGEEEELGLSDPTWQIIECQCCFLAMPDKLAVQCPEDPTHLFCMDCLALHANQQIQHRRGYIRCLSISATQWHPCTARFRLSDLEDYLEGDILQELMELEKQGLADEEDNDTPGMGDIWGIESCPFCGWAAIFPGVTGLGGGPLFQCRRPGCCRVICRQCREVVHPSMSCQRLRSIKRWLQEAEAAERRQKQGEAKGKVKESINNDPLDDSKCACPNPRCKAPVMKDCNCNAAICPSCKGMFCWLCRKDISRLKFNHFDMDGGCQGKMYTGLIDPGEVQVANAREWKTANGVNLRELSSAHNRF